MSVIEPDKISDMLIAAADEFILPRYNTLSNHQISTKTGPNDLVTQADLDVENYLKRVLPEALPGSVFIGEEGVSNGDVSLDALNDSSQPVWIADPVDGTFNFVHGRREFAVMLGLVIGGKTQYGWIYDVLGGEVTVAEEGAGAFCDGVRLEVTQVKEASEMVGHISAKYFPQEYRAHINVQRESFKDCRTIGCAAHEYLRVAKGQAQFSVYSRLKPWDHIPGALIVREAGGAVTAWDGKAYKPQDFDKGIVVTANDNDGWKDILDIFMP